MTSPVPPQDATADAAPPEAGDDAQARARLLLVSDEAVAAGLEERLSAAGFEVSRVSGRAAVETAKGLRPAVVLLAFGGREGEGALVTLARRLRADQETFATPVVFLFREDARTLRSAALHAGADDYFSQDAPAEEIRARLVSLLWRVEAARRTAPVAGEQRDEIDNFIFLLDAVGADSRDGLVGAVALAEAEGGVARPGPLDAAHAFLKLNLRRADAVAFYGPTTLVVYLPRADAATAHATLSRLCEEFRAARPGSDLRAGVASFPADGSEVESLVEKAEVALRQTRDENFPARVVVYGEDSSSHDSLAPALVRDETRTARTGAEASTLARPGGASAADALEAPPTRSVAEAGAAAPPVVTSDVDGPRRQPEDFGARRAAAPRRMMLVISDAARMAQVNLLMRSASYEVRAAFDANHALSLLRIDSPDVLLVDYALHGTDGLEMLRRLGQQSGGGRLTPAVLLTPAGREDVGREALEAGARAVVALPYDPVELLDTLRAADDREE